MTRYDRPPDALVFGSDLCACVTACNAARQEAWAPSGFAFEVKYQVNDEKIS